MFLRKVKNAINFMYVFYKLFALVNHKFSFPFIFLSMLRPSAINRVSWIASLQRATKQHFQRNVGDTVSWWTASVPWPKTAAPTMARWDPDAFSFAVQDRQHHQQCTFTVSPFNVAEDSSSCHGNPQRSTLTTISVGHSLFGLIAKMRFILPCNCLCSRSAREVMHAVSDISIIRNNGATSPR